MLLVMTMYDPMRMPSMKFGMKPVQACHVMSVYCRKASNAIELKLDLKTLPAMGNPPCPCETCSSRSSPIVEVSTIQPAEPHSPAPGAALLTHMLHRTWDVCYPQCSLGPIPGCTASGTCWGWVLGCSACSGWHPKPAQVGSVCAGLGMQVEGGAVHVLDLACELDPHYSSSLQDQMSLKSLTYSIKKCVF